MDEDQFRAIYHQINQQRCVFEKALLQRRCTCTHKQTFLLANREGVACGDAKTLVQCTEFLHSLRSASRFALHELSIDGPLPHNKELKVQAGGCQALQNLLSPNAKEAPEISQLLQLAIQQYQTIAQFPYSELVRGVVHYVSRPSRRT